MKFNHPNVLHYFDYPHVVKLLRNSLLNRNLVKNGEEFNIRIVLPHAETLGLRLNDVLPSDKMSLKHVLNLVVV